MDNVAMAPVVNGRPTVPPIRTSGRIRRPSIKLNDNVCSPK